MNYKQVGLARLAGFFIGVATLSLLLRIFYSGHLLQDDGLWFTAAEELLRGKAPYSEIYSEKRPLFLLHTRLCPKVFGAHITTIRLFTVFYSDLAAFMKSYRAVGATGHFLVYRLKEEGN